MALGSDSVSLIMVEIGKELRFYEDTLALFGLYYVGKMSISITWSVYKGIKQHLGTKMYPTRDLATTLGPWAVVTGVTEHIGKAFAFELARRGMSIILIDRDLHTLESVSSEIEEEFGINTKIIQSNLTDGKVLDEYTKRDLGNIDIGILVNTFELKIERPIPFFRMSDEEIINILNSNVTLFTLISHHVLNGMLHRNRGVILNLSAFSGLYPIPYISVYSASKAYVEYLSRALNMECMGTDVSVMTLTPGVIKPDNEKKAKSLCSYVLPNISSFVINTIDSLVLTDSQTITGSWLFSMQLWLLQRVPEFVLRYIVCDVMRSAARS